MLHIEKLKKQFGVQEIFQDAELDIYPGDRVGLVAPNGSGKTTLFRLITGEDTPDAGIVSLPPHFSVGLLSQESQCRLGVTVREEMESAVPEIAHANERIRVLAEKLNEPDDESFESREALRHLSDAQQELEMQEAHTLQARIGRVMHGLGFASDALERRTDEFSGGWQMRIAMAKLLLREPDLLLLDEPTNHLDVAARRWLQKYLQDYHGAVFVISHEPQFLNAVVERIIEIDNHQFIAYSGNYEFYRRQKEENRERQQAAFERQERELERQQEFIERFGAKASKASQVKSREKQLDKIERIEAPKAEKPSMAKFEFPAAEKSAQDVLRLRNVSKTYGENVVLLEVEMKIKRGDRIALLGENGAGKSTLLRLLAGREEPSSGEIEWGRNVITGYFAQHQAEALEGRRTVLQEVLHGLDSQPEGMARSLLGRLGVRGESAYKPVQVLSGGERSRVALAKFLLRPANFLLLDEPTNHLDANSRAILQEALQSFEGTLIVASHDRTFINAVAAEAYTIEAGVLHEERQSLSGGKQSGGKKGKGRKVPV